MKSLGVTRERSASLLLPSTLEYLIYKCLSNLLINVSGLKVYLRPKREGKCEGNCTTQ